MVRSLQQNILLFTAQSMSLLSVAYMAFADFDLFLNYTKLSVLVGMLVGLMTMEDDERICPLTPPPSRKASDAAEEKESDSESDTMEEVVKELFPSEETETETDQLKTAETVEATNADNAPAETTVS